MHMKITVIYHPESDHARLVEEFSHELNRRHGVSPELVSLETREGAAMASLYDVTQYPAVVAVRDNGQVAQTWIGENLPLMNEVAAYMIV